MEIKVRTVHQFKQVLIDFDNGMTWDSGLLNDAEVTELAKQFIAAADELIPS